MTNLGDFYDLVRTEAKRGTTLDSSIPSKVRQAVRQMERLHTFKHMEIFLDYAIVATATYPRIVTLPARLKRMMLWRIVNSDGSFSRITEVDASDQSKVDVGKPSGFWQSGEERLWLDNTPDQNYSTELYYAAYTSLPGDLAIDVPILTTFEDVILNQTMVNLGPLLRDDKVMAMYKANRDEAMNESVNADIDNRQGARSESMQYGWEFKEDVNGSNA